MPPIKTQPSRWGWRTLTLAVLPLLAATADGQDWPSFRGPNGSGVAASAGTPSTWNVARAEGVRWKTAIPGLAHASPIVWAGRVYLTTAVVEAPDLKVDVKIGPSGIDPAADQVRHSWRLLCLDATTGKVLWERTVHQGIPRMKRHVKASHASATPATDGEHLVALLGSEGLFCFDMTGRLLWKRDLGLLDVGLVDDPTYQWGPASSPILYQGLVIVQNDRHKDSSLAAFDVKTGEPVWRAAREEMPSWATPLVYRGEGRAELVTNSPRQIRGYDPLTGKELWRLADDDTQVKVPTPIAGDGMILVTGGYPGGGRPIYAIKPGGSGDLTGPKGAATNPNLWWRVERGSPYTPTPILYQGYLYVCADNGILTAYDARTGQKAYQERLSVAAGGFSASPVAADGKLYFTSEDGEVFVVRAGPRFELLATNSMGEVCMATPAISGTTLFIRTRTHLVAIG